MVLFLSYLFNVYNNQSLFPVFLNLNLLVYDILRHKLAAFASDSVSERQNISSRRQGPQSVNHFWTSFVLYKTVGSKAECLAQSI